MDGSIVCCLSDGDPTRPISLLANVSRREGLFLSSQIFAQEANIGILIPDQKELNVLTSGGHVEVIVFTYINYGVCVPQTMLNEAATLFDLFGFGKYTY